MLPGIVWKPYHFFSGIKSYCSKRRLGKKKNDIHQFHEKFAAFSSCSLNDVPTLVNLNIFKTEVHSCYSNARICYVSVEFFSRCIYNFTVDRFRKNKVGHFLKELEANARRYIWNMKLNVQLSPLEPSDNAHLHMNFNLPTEILENPLSSQGVSLSRFKMQNPQVGLSPIASSKVINLPVKISSISLVQFRSCAYRTFRVLFLCVCGYNIRTCILVSSKHFLFVCTVYLFVQCHMSFST